MAKYRLTNKAVRDLSDIWLYTLGNWSEKQADKYYNMLIAHCGKAANNPSLGRNYSIVKDGLKGIMAGKHIIFYIEVSTNEIEVIRILHGSMDIKNQL